MADNSKAVFISLDQILWDFTEIIVTGGGGFEQTPSASPFLWTIFFKVDGDSINTSSQAVIFPTDGNHGDLDVGDVGPFALIAIPENLGTTSMNVTPMPAFINQQGLSSLFGVIVVLMNDGGHVTSDGIEAGHEALNAGAQEVLNSLVQQALLNFSAPSQNQIDAAIANFDFPDKVKDAITGEQSICENVWAISGADSEIGHAIRQFSLNDFNNGSGTQSFEIDIPDNGGNTWKITGSVTVSDTCPASASAEIFDPIFSGISISGAGTEMKERDENHGIQSFNELVELMRNFRDKKQLLRHTTFNDWWNLIKTYSPELAYRLGSSEGIKPKIIPLVNALVSHLKDDHRKISKGTIKEVTEVLDILQEKSTCKLTNELRASKILISRMENYTLAEALHALATRRLRTKSFKR